MDKPNSSSIYPPILRKSKQTAAAEGLALETLPGHRLISQRERPKTVVIDLRSRIRSLWRRRKVRRPALVRRAADGGLVYSEAIDSRKLHSAWIGERGSVVTEGRGHIPLVLHRERIKAGIVEHVKYAPTQFK